MRVNLESGLDVNNGYYAVKFGAQWCAPCKRIDPLLKKIESDFDGVNFISVDVDENPDLAQHFQIRTVPTLLLIKNGYIKRRIPGLVLIEPLRKAFRDLLGDSESMAETAVA